MLRLPPRLTRHITAMFAAVCLTGCGWQRTSDNGSPPPAGEFLLSSADSTFWISTIGGKAKTRGAPLLLARYGGRFYELFTADDDFSYENALLLGQRVYRRDLLTGDSSIVFIDTSVARVANAYARAHPDEQPLGPNEEGDADPSTSATAEVDILDVFGPYLSFEHHVDIDLPGHPSWHSTRRGVLDLRSGKQTTVTDLFGASAARRLEAAGLHMYEAERDSILGFRTGLDAHDRRAVTALAHLHFDPRSFVLSDIDGQPAVSFGVPGEGEGAAGHLVELEPLKLDSSPPPGWWHDVRRGVATTDDEGKDRWDGAGYHILARYDTSGKSARLSISDSLKREWPLAVVGAPLRRIDWLDHPALADSDRRALTRAFNDAASYDEGTRVALTHAPATLSLVTRSGTSHASLQDRQRKSTRNVRAHDAGNGEQPGSRLRRRGSFDDGQVRRDLRASPHADVGGHSLDRPRRLSRTDSSRRLGCHAVERQLRGANVDGSRRPRRSGGSGNGQSTTHQLVLFDVRCG